MTALAAFKESNAWHKDLHLPVSPQNNNPWIYLAWAVKLIERHDAVDLSLTGFWQHVVDNLWDCEMHPGLFNRWPDGSGGCTSHDELIGICYLDRDVAKRVYAYLVEHDGDYNNTGEPPPAPDAWNLNRFGWFISFVKSRAGIKLSLLSQLWFAAHVMWHSFKAKPDSDDASGTLLIWIMYEEMSKHWMCRAALRHWSTKLKSLGITPKTMLTLEPRENPVYAQYAEEEFW